MHKVEERVFTDIVKERRRRSFFQLDSNLRVALLNCHHQIC
jgi:hypothetical protein